LIAHLDNRSLAAHSTTHAKLDGNVSLGPRILRVVAVEGIYMVKSFKLSAICLLALPVVALAHDSGSTPPFDGRLRYGGSATVGGASMRTYVLLSTTKDANGRRAPQEVGVEIPRSMFWGLPGEGTASLIDLPITARDTPFQYMMIDWNPQGHPPAGVYTLPHFDFHFYIQDFDEVEGIRPGPCSGLNCEDFTKAMKPVPALYTPQGYINVGSVVPVMGNHLIDPTSPEFSGKKFTRTFLYGAYDGKLTFLEPMITLDSLLQTPNQCTDFRSPQEVAVSGYYPRKYCTALDAERGVHKVYLTDFVYKAATQLTQAMPQ
jgi:hypothetical protein